MELATRRLLGDGSGIEVSSAGTHGFADHPMSEEMIGGYETEAAELPQPARDRRPGRGGRPGAHRRGRAPHLPARGDPGAFRKVFTLGQFAEAVEALGAAAGRRVATLVAEIGRHRSQADPRHDVDDPYRTGPEIARACAARIDGLLAIVVPALRPTQASQ